MSTTSFAMTTTVSSTSMATTAAAATATAAASIHTLAQELNNQGSRLLCRGFYNEGIIVLSKALKLTEKDLNKQELAQEAEETATDNHERKAASCFNCRYCSLEACLSGRGEDDAVANNYGETAAAKHHRAPEISTTIDDRPEKRHRKRRRRHSSGNKNHNFNGGGIDGTPLSTIASRSRIDPTMDCNDDDDDDAEGREIEDDENECGGYVYRRFLFVNRRCIKERHYMGLTLPLIIMLNLALAYHSKVVDPQDDENDDADSVTVTLQKAIKLYELAYQLHLDILTHQQQQEQEHRGLSKEEEEDYARSQALSTLRLTIIISNNLSTIHKLVGNQMKYRTCVEHLLSVVMYYTTIIQPQQQSNGSSNHQASSTKEDVLSSTEFDGILRNVSSIVLHGVCASAA